MEKEQIPQGRIFNSIQEFFSFGYFYLLFLGIINSAIFYGILGVDIIRYSNALDVLLSPVALLTDNVRLPIIILVTLILLAPYGRAMNRMNDKLRVKKKKLEDKENGSLSRQDSLKKLWWSFATMDILFSRGKALHPSQTWIILALLTIFGMYTGLGLGSGYKIKERMESESIEMEHLIFFQNNKAVKANIIGKNSTYLFYVTEGSQSLIISPIPGNVYKIEQLPVEQGLEIPLKKESNNN